MSKPKTCGQCQREIPDQAPFGICPVCVLNLATDENQSANTESHPSSENVIPEPHELSGKFPNLEIVSLLGQGGMGAVYLARQTSLDRIVALKVLSRSLAKDPSFTERFIREAKTLAKLTHPNIVTVFDSGQAGDASYLVMEYVDGVNLRDAIAAHEIDASRALAIVQQICDALQHAHDTNVIHRDIKPENILIDRNGHVKIADFGLAKLLQPKPEQYSLTGTRQVLGTRNYMAPEQIESPESVDHRADLYSLGVVLYELLTGELPIGRFAPPSDKSGCSKRLDDLVMKTLAKDPGQRFQQASMIGSAVREIESSVAPALPRTPLVEAVTRTDHYINSVHRPGNEPYVAPIPFAISKLKSDYKPSVKHNIAYYLAKANGLVHLRDDRIELEYRILDSVVSKESELKTHSVDLKDLANVQVEPSLWGGAKMRFRAMSLSAVDEIPNSKQGTFYLDVNHRDKAAAKEFADATNRMIVSRSPNRTSAIREKSDDSSVTLEEIVLVDERLKVPKIGFQICAVLNLMIGLLVTGLTFLSIPNEALRKWLIGGSPVVEELFFFAGPFLLLISILPWCAAKSIQHHRNLHLLVVVLLAMLLPWLSFPLLIQIPLAIWTLIVLCLPVTRKVFRNALLVNRMQKQPLPNPKRNYNLIVGVVAGVPLILFSLILMTWGFSSSQVDPARFTDAPTAKIVSSTGPIASEASRFTAVPSQSGPPAPQEIATARSVPSPVLPEMSKRGPSARVPSQIPMERLRLSAISLFAIVFVSVAGLILLAMLTLLLTRLKRSVSKR